MIQLWRPIPGYEGHYEAGDLGEIRSVDRQVRYPNGNLQLHRGRVLKQTPATSGYLSVGLNKQGGKTFGVHTLVLLAFRGPCPEGMECCHTDGNRLNNRLTNLRWDTRVNNHKDRKLHGTVKKGESHWNSRLTEDAVREIRARRMNGEVFTKIAQSFGISQTTTIHICQRKIWDHVA